jgi:protease II
MQEEDEYAKAILEPTLPLQEELYNELRSAIQEADQSAPVRCAARLLCTAAILCMQ